jgi:hypothetical protein
MRNDDFRFSYRAAHSRQRQPAECRLETLEDARSFVNDALAARRTPPWRELHARLKEVKSEDDAIEAIGALRGLLMMEGLLQSDRSHG